MLTAVMGYAVWLLKEQKREKQAEKIEISSLPIGAFIVSAGQDLLPRFSRIAQQCTLHYSALR